MKKSFNIKTVLSLALLMIAGIYVPQQVNAQRFGHGGFGGGNNGGNQSVGQPTPGRPVAQNHPTMQNHPAPAPVVNHPQQNNNYHAPVDNHPAPAYHAPVDNHPVHENINGGSYNNGHHDFNQHENVVIHDNRPVDRRYENERGNIYHINNYRGIHPYAYHPFHPFVFGPRWHPVGFFLNALAFNAFRFSVGNQWYYYDNGCYYVPYQRGYTVVSPPIGAIVNYLPDGFETVPVNNDTYFYYGGTFYINIGDRYQVVQAPYGAVVSQLPVGAVEQDINGQTLMVYNNTYFEPIYQDGQDSYEVVPIN